MIVMEYTQLYGFIPDKDMDIGVSQFSGQPPYRIRDPLDRSSCFIQGFCKVQVEISHLVPGFITIFVRCHISC